MKKPKDGDRIILTKKVETFAPIEDGRWKPVEGNTKIGTYGIGTPTPSPTLQEMAEKDVAEYYPYLIKGSPEYLRRVAEFLAKY